MEHWCILLANEPRSYREVIAGTLRQLRPQWPIADVEPAVLPAHLGRCARPFVIASRLSEPVRQRACGWVLLYPDFEDRATIGVAGLDLDGLRHARVLDAGCGMGRHARQLAAYCGGIVAVDFSRAIDAAARNVHDLPNVACVQADLTRVPVADNAFDFVYSMGVVHHLANTEDAVRTLARKVRPGGRLRVYLYWKRSGLAGRVLRLVSAVRRVTTRLPFPLLKALCWTLSVGLYAGVVLPYRALLALGLRVPEHWPLFVYTKYPFRILYNDQFDRFSAPLEKRYSEAEARALLESAGLRDVRTLPMFGWLVDGVR
jgi:SAM-dependent methyltransferase